MKQFEYWFERGILFEMGRRWQPRSLKGEEVELKSIQREKSKSPTCQEA
ncbi:MAG TPA: hypothetical protein VGT24_02655 [Candidatus Acidoferrales bacterium]|nr:hypothetical protein [Candidatus Acidoferrales bacterium]